MEDQLDFDENNSGINDDEIFGYECLGCGHIQDYPGECEKCCAYALEPMYF